MASGLNSGRRRITLPLHGQESLVAGPHSSVPGGAGSPVVLFHLRHNHANLYLAIWISVAFRKRFFPLQHVYSEFHEKLRLI